MEKITEKAMKANPEILTQFGTKVVYTDKATLLVDKKPVFKKPSLRGVSAKMKSLANVSKAKSPRQNLRAVKELLDSCQQYINEMENYYG